MSIVAVLLSAWAINTGSADPRIGQIDVRAFCRTHPDDDGPGEENRTDLPSAVAKAGATYWRCDAGQVMVCDGGATGEGCLKTEPAVGNRLAELEQYCLQNPGAAGIPDSITMGLAQFWKCKETRPVATETVPADAKGYFVDEWTALP